MPLERLSSSTILQMESEPIGRVIIDGVNCRLRVGPDVELTANILVFPEVVNASIEIGARCKIGGVIRVVRGKGGTIRIGDDTTFTTVGISLHEAGVISIGSDCMLSTDIQMDASDMHPIYDRETGERLNPAKDIEIGDHVWLGTRVLVLKGAKIGSGSIIAAGSIVAGEIPENVMAMGIPARVVRENVIWTRDMDEKPKLVPGSGPATQPVEADAEPEAAATEPAAKKKGWFR